MYKTGTKQTVQCYHCGETCKDTSIVFDEKNFCCEGCKAIYDLLRENNLCTYYSLEANPGAQAQEYTYKGRFDYLDDPGIKSRLLTFSHENIDHVKFYIPKIHCSSCIWLLEHLDKINKGILSCKVDFFKKEVTIGFNRSGVRLSQVAELLSRIGYEPLISLNDIEHKKEKWNRREEIIKIGIAGFCFGNVMMMSFPEYFASGDFHNQSGLKYFFSFLNLALSLPVLFYSASSFFVSGWKSLRYGHLNIDAPIALAILVTFARSVYEITTFTGAGYLDSMTGIVFFMLIGRYFQNRTYDALSFDRDYKSYFPLGVVVIKDGAEKNVPASSLKTGDRIRIRNQELVPADAVLLSAETHIDYSFLTGESDLVKKKSGELVYAGARQAGGAVDLEVVKPVSQSYLTQLWNNDDESKGQAKNKISFVDKVNKYFTIVVLAIAALSALGWWFYDSSKILNAFTAVLIVACPCGLLLTTTFANGNTLRIFGRNKFYLKNSKVIEKLATSDVVVFDKTGTITHGSDIKFKGDELSLEEKQMVYALAAQSSHPLAAKIRQQYAGIKGDQQVSHFTEYPGKGITGIVNGKEISLGSDHFIIGHAIPGKTATSIYVEIEDQVKGHFSFNAHYRTGLQQLVQELSGKHELQVLSGDNAAEKNNLQQVFGTGTVLLFEQKPEDKKKHIRQLQENGRQVIMLGDGLNDAGALLQSDVGIAVSDNTNTFSPACDAILDGAALRLLPKFISLAASTRRIITTTFILSIIYNVTGLFFAVQGTLSPVIAAVLMPASTITIVLLTTLCTQFTARQLKL